MIHEEEDQTSSILALKTYLHIICPFVSVEYQWYHAETGSEPLPQKQAMSNSGLDGLKRMFSRA
jgi:hypothetical protein